MTTGWPVTGKVHDLDQVAKLRLVAVSLLGRGLVERDVLTKSEAVEVALTDFYSWLARRG